MSILFEPMRINNMELRNRFVRSATYDGCSDTSGHVTEKQLHLFSDLANGGVGLIITGLTYVHDSGRLSPFQNSIADDGCIPGLKRLTAVVHEHGAKIAVQLSHTGREAVLFFKDNKKRALAPSFVDDDPYFTGQYSAITEEEIRNIIRAFGNAAKRARAAGFDAVQVHGAHAYLLSQFLSPYTNRRSDKWGGSLMNRLRFHRKLCRRIRQKVGEDYPVLIKIGVEDGFPGGLDFNEGRLAAQLLARWGFDALEVSQGLRGKPFKGTEFRTQINCVDHEAYFRDWCKEIKRLVKVPTMMVGGLRTFALMQKIVEKKEADFISLCRPLIREPEIVNTWKNDENHRATCISCNLCLIAVRKRETLHCSQKI